MNSEFDKSSNRRTRSRYSRKNEKVIKIVEEMKKIRVKR